MTDYEDDELEHDEEEDQEPDGEKKMPFWDHLEELRWHIMRSLIAIVVGAIGAYIFSDQVIAWLQEPYPLDKNLVYLGPADPFLIKLKISGWIGIIFALPIIVFEFWRFVAPGLYEKEKKHVPTIIILTFFCFIVGGAFAYYVVFPIGMQFFIEVAGEHLDAMISIDKYVSFMARILIAFGIVFELPLLSLLLTRVGLLTPEFLRKYRGYAIVIMFVMAAVITPPDVFTQILLALPLLILYEISIYISKVFQPKDEFED